MLRPIYDRTTWDAVLKKVAHFDFYHTYDYHQLSKSASDIPVLLTYSENNTLIAIPLLIRSIENSKFRDATSVYGYVGPVHNGMLDNFDTLRFKNCLSSFFEENDIITVFSRLHPFIEGQQSILSGMGKILDIGKVVNIDITKPLDMQRSGYNRRLRTHVNKTDALCHVKIAETHAEVIEFFDIYTRTMQRLDAEEYYFFRKKYFFDMLDNDGFKTEIRLCIDNATGDILGGVMFVTTNGIVQYHLSATKERYRHVYPTKLIIDDMRQKSTKRGNKYLNLGGGLGSSEDCLFQFKASFSSDFRYFKMWKWVVDQKVNQQLINTIEYRNSSEFLEKGTKYFPVYRIKI